MVLLVGIAMVQMNKADALTKKLSGESFRRASMLQEWQSIIEVNAVRTLAAIKESDELRKDIVASMQGDPAALALFADVDKERDAYRVARKTALDKKAAGDTEAVARFVDPDMLPRVQS